MQQESFRPPLIGRTQDLGFLHKRLKRPGLTILAAEPMAGKTYLLQHFQEELIETGEYSIGNARGRSQTALLKDAPIPAFIVEVLAA